jgi:hypothetical protein
VPSEYTTQTSWLSKNLIGRHFKQGRAGSQGWALSSCDTYQQTSAKISPYRWDQRNSFTRISKWRLKTNHQFHQHPSITVPIVWLQTHCGRPKIFWLDFVSFILPPHNQKVKR